MKFYSFLLDEAITSQYKKEEGEEIKIKGRYYINFLTPQNHLTGDFDGNLDLISGFTVKCGKFFGKFGFPSCSGD